MKVSEILAYHGSQPRATTGFALSHTGHVSSEFAQYTTQRWGVFFTNNPQYAALYGDVEQYELLIAHTADLDQQRVFHDLVGRFVDLMLDTDTGVAASARQILQGHWSVWQLFELDVGRQFVSFLLNEGYDSATYTEYTVDHDDVEHESLTTVVLRPHLIVQHGQLNLDI